MVESFSAMWKVRESSLILNIGGRKRLMGVLSVEEKMILSVSLDVYQRRITKFKYDNNLLWS
jgi:hypothetical protein